MWCNNSTPIQDFNRKFVHLKLLKKVFVNTEITEKLNFQKQAHLHKTLKVNKNLTVVPDKFHSNTIAIPMAWNWLTIQ
jgi:hypothetical protein